MDFIPFPEILDDNSEVHIEFFFEDIEEITLDNVKIQTWIEQIASIENKNLGNLNIIFCSDEFLLNINMEYLNHDTLTDIITFQERPDEISGELYISLPRVNENAMLHNTSFSNELHRVIIHGILHMCGYSDKTKHSEILMRAKEDWALSLLA
jgi:probable rRNA maturation factor